MSGGKLFEFRETQKLRRRRAVVLRLAFLFGAVGLFVIAALWVVVRSSIFQLEHLTIISNGAVSAEDITSLLRASMAVSSWTSRVLGFENMLTWPDQLTGEVLRFSPTLKSATVSRDFGIREVTVRVEERTPLAVWCFKNDVGSSCYWFDDEGVAFKRFFAVEGNLIPFVNDYSQADTRLLGKVLDAHFIPNLITIFEVLRNAALSVKEVKLKDLTLQEIEVETNDGPRFLFSLRFPATNALKVIQSLGEKSEWKELDYIDFRVENRAYYK